VSGANGHLRIAGAALSGQREEPIVISDVAGFVLPPTATAVRKQPLVTQLRTALDTYVNGRL
jgi:hypothetical protein